MFISNKMNNQSLGLLSKLKGDENIETKDTGIVFQITCHNLPQDIELILDKENSEHFFIQLPEMLEFFKKGSVKYIQKELDMKIRIFLDTFKDENDMPYEKSVEISDTYACWLINSMSRYGFDVRKIESSLSIKENGELKQKYLKYNLDALRVGVQD